MPAPSESRQHDGAIGLHIVSMTDIEIQGIDSSALARVLDRGIDSGGNPIEPFTDSDGSWPLRCCLVDSQSGDRIAIIAWSPLPWRGAYAETGPIVVHVGHCSGPSVKGRLPPELDAQPMTLRPYGPDHRIAYNKVRHVPGGASLTAHVGELLEDQGIEIVHGRNVTEGCFSFQASRAQRR